MLPLNDTKFLKETLGIHGPGADIKTAFVRDLIADWLYKQIERYSGKIVPLNNLCVDFIICHDLCLEVTAVVRQPIDTYVNIYIRGSAKYLFFWKIGECLCSVLLLPVYLFIRFFYTTLCCCMFTI